MEDKARDSNASAAASAAAAAAAAALVKRDEEEEEEKDSALGRALGTDGSGRASATKNPSAGAQLTIFYNGSVNVYDAVPPEKAQAIMFTAAAAAAVAAATSSGNNMNVSRTPAMVVAAAASPALTRSLSQQSSSTTASLQPTQFLTNPSPYLCKLQAELPLARRHSLQRFLEKRRDRAPFISEKNFDGMEVSMDAKPELL